MFRYLKLYSHFVRTSLALVSIFRFDFVTRIVMDLIFCAVSLAFFNVVFVHTTILAGWTLPQLYLFVATFMFVDGFHMTFFADSFWGFGSSTNKGELDYLIVRPCSAFFLAMFRQVSLSSSVNMLISGGLVIWSMDRLGEFWSWFGILYYTVFLILGITLYICSRVICLTAIFWMGGERGLNELHFSMTHLAERPDSVYPYWIRFLLLTLLPFGLIASFPARAFFETPSVTQVVLIFSVAACYILFANKLWSAGLKRYSSASS